jgi:hypothetical protein
MASFIQKVSFRDFVVDLFGSLVPGALFLAGTVATIGWPFWLVLSRERDASAAGFLQSLSPAFKWDAGVGIEMHFLVIALAYVFGFFFFRQGVKTADLKSFRLLRREFTPAALANWVCQDDRECEYPYTNLVGYLKQRNLHHLADLVPWNRLAAADSRSKTFINVCKLRVLSRHPRNYAPIAHAEAHIRLMSSSWHAARALAALSVGGLVLGTAWLARVQPGIFRPRVAFLLPGLAALAFLFWAFNRSTFWAANANGAGWWALQGRRFLRKWSLGIAGTAAIVISLALAGKEGHDFAVAARPLVLSYSVLLASLLVFSSVECFLHYQRVREIVLVLESAHQVFGSALGARSGLTGSGGAEQGPRATT